MILLGIETSCDETAAAIVENGRKVHSNIIASQIDIHREFGGVVPEIAARKHINSISYIVKQALNAADMPLSEIEGIAVSNGPGLVGALLVGLSFAKAMAFARKVPLLGVNHIYSHICSNYLEEVSNGGHPNQGHWEPPYEGHPREGHWEPPFICLVVSGGHTHLIEVVDYHDCRILGRTRDDAAGEAFDKVGRALGLPYPGGPEIDKLAKEGDPKAIPFPRATFEDSVDFSFSGLKSAVLQYLQKNKNYDIADIAASFQQAVIDVLISNAVKACKQKGLKKIAIAGGVAANTGLRKAFAEECNSLNLILNLPQTIYCTDNAAMAASGGYYRYKSGKTDKYDLNAFTRDWNLESGVQGLGYKL